MTSSGWERVTVASEGGWGSILNPEPDTRKVWPEGLFGGWYLAIKHEDRGFSLQIGPVATFAELPDPDEARAKLAKIWRLAASDTVGPTFVANRRLVEGASNELYWLKINREPLPEGNPT